MIIRATLTLQDQSTRSRDFESQELADAWIAEAGDAETYGPKDSYTVATEDVTAKVEQAESDRQAIERGLKKQDVGAKSVAMLNQVHEEMALDTAGLAALVADQRLLMAVTLVRNGAIQSGRDIFLTVAPTHYSAAQIERILRPITDFLAQ